MLLPQVRVSMRVIFLSPNPERVSNFLHDDEQSNRKEVAEVILRDYGRLNKTNKLTN